MLQVLYLIFNEGYAATAGDQLHRVDLTTEAIRLTRMLHRLLPEEPEVAGLLALMLLTDARRPARSHRAGDLVTMEHQQRDQWDRALTAEGTALITAAMRQRQVGPYQLQAAIAALHNGAPSYAETDWPQIAALYAWLEQLTPTPPVRLSRAVAVAMAYGPRRGICCAGQPRRRPAHPAAGASRPRPLARTQWRHPAGRRSLPRSGGPHL